MRGIGQISRTNNYVKMDSNLEILPFLKVNQSWISSDPSVSTSMLSKPKPWRLRIATKRITLLLLINSNHRTLRARVTWSRLPPSVWYLRRRTSSSTIKREEPSRMRTASRGTVTTRRSSNSLRLPLRLQRRLKPVLQPKMRASGATSLPQWGEHGSDHQLHKRENPLDEDCLSLKRLSAPNMAAVLQKRLSWIGSRWARLLPSQKRVGLQCLQTTNKV